jgi:hypothetical protein
MSDKHEGVFNAILTGNEESLLLALFNSYADHLNHISIKEFFKFCLDKQLVTNISPLHLMQKIFFQAAGDKPYFNKPRFFFAINLLARVLHKDELFPLDPMLNNLLYTKTKENLEETPIFDDETEILISEGILELFEKTEDGFFSILATFNKDNVQKGRKVVGIQEIKNKNLGISPRDLIRYLKFKGGVFESVLSIQEFQRIIQEVKPPQTDMAKKYFLYGHLRKFYEKNNQTSEISRLKKILAEPEIRLHELQIILGKIALRGFQSIDGAYDRVFELLETKLSLSSNKDIPIQYSLEQDLYIPFGEIESRKQILSQIEKNEYTKVETPNEKFNILEILSQIPPYPGTDQIEKLFDQERVPPIPDEPKTIQENPPPFLLPAILHPLKSPNSKDRDPKSENRLGRSETPNSKLKFVQMPGFFQCKSPQQSRFDSFEKIRRTLNSNLLPEPFPQMLGNPSTNPCLIKEVFSLPETFDSVSKKVQSCYTFISKGELKNAILSISKAKNENIRLEGKTLKPELFLFFELTLASIFESCKKYKLALGSYFSLKNTFNALSFNHPDQALFYCGLGYALHHVGDARLATRSYLMAKRIRERCIGGDTLETANVYNNLGVCMFSLGRFHESLAYFQLCEAIFYKFLGPRDSKTAIVSQNIAKVKRQNFLPAPEFKSLWAKQFEDPFAVKKKKKEKKKGKKGNIK